MLLEAKLLSLAMVHGAISMIILDKQYSPLYKSQLYGAQECGDDSKPKEKESLAGEICGESLGTEYWRFVN
jgi:hypothetical protein